MVNFGFICPGNYEMGFMYICMSNQNKSYIGVVHKPCGRGRGKGVGQMST